MGPQFAVTSFKGLVNMKVQRFTNLDAFDLNLKIDPSAASKFIDARKNPNGVVDRTVVLKITYKISDTQLSAGNDKEMMGELLSIEVWAQINGKPQKLGVLSKKA